MSHRHTTVAALLALVLVLAACGGDSKVGSDALLEGTGGEGNLSLGSTTTVTAQEQPAEAAPTETTAPPAATPPPAPTTTAPPPQDTVAVEIEIRGDDVSPQMNPPVARVFAGSTIRWRNVDSEPRSVKADDGSFFSGDIPPGGTWEHTFGSPGVQNYKDGTRPYVTAQVEVLA